MRNYRYLTLADRETLEASYLKGARPQDIADTLDVHVATIYKELKRGDTGKLDGDEPLLHFLGLSKNDTYITQHEIDDIFTVVHTRKEANHE